MGELPRQPTQEGESVVGIDESPEVRNGNIELAIVAQAAADLSQMRVLLSTRKMLDDVVGDNEVEAPVRKREFGPEDPAELILRTDPFVSTASTAKVPDSPNRSLEK